MLEKEERKAMKNLSTKLTDKLSDNNFIHVAIIHGVNKMAYLILKCKFNNKYYSLLLFYDFE